MSSKNAAATVPAADNFTAGPLYKKLVQVLPAYVQDPFTDNASLNVQRLRSAMGKSHEAVYKWLRSSRLTPTNAEQLVALANGDKNASALASLGRKPPTLSDFLPFVFTA